MGVLFGSAIGTAIFRTGIRMKLRRCVYFDDAFLGVACLALTATTTMLYKKTWNLLPGRGHCARIRLGRYGGPAGRCECRSNHSKIPTNLLSARYIVLDSYFFGQVHFLSLFHQLLDRLPRFLLYWKVIVVANVVALVYCICYAFLECPHSNLEARE